MKFSEYFWNTEICNFTGFDVLCQRIRDGRKVSKDYIDFLRQRAQVQELYGKALVKLSKSLGGKEEIGSLRQAWEVMRTETDNIGQQHIEASGQVISEANKISDLMDRQKMQRKQVEEQLKRTQMAMKNAWRKVQEMKKMYYSRCKEKDILDENIQSIDFNRSLAQSKEMEKFTQKQNRAQQAVESSNAAYCSALETLEDLHQHWESEMITTCEYFQKLEEERIDALRNSMWILTNVGSIQCVREDDMNEEIRKALENCVIGTDIELFINLHQTGTIKPDHIVYEAYQSNKQSRSSTPCQMKKMLDQSSPETDDNQDQKIFMIDMSPEVAVNNAIYETILRDEREFDEIKCVVLYDFEARDETEISLEKDDVVRVTNACDPDWWQVETEDNRKGYFPVIYMEILEQESD